MTHGLPLVGHVRFARKFKILYRWCGHRGQRKEGKKEEKSEHDGERQQLGGMRKKKSTTWRSERIWQNERDSDYVGEDSNKMVLTTYN
ncbi:hypothetical protein TNCV_3970241 [Trichonephila clavipes]|nr:hypothetical protein TNCV_3970241 [Trichonephila clavipes]